MTATKGTCRNIGIVSTRKKFANDHRHKIDIDIQSNWFFFSWVALFFIIGALFWTVADLRKTSNQYADNDLKYRYVKMIGQTNEDSFTRLEHQFQYSDSIKIIRKQVDKYEELVKDQAERMERMKKDYRIQNNYKMKRNH